MKIDKSTCGASGAKRSGEAMSLDKLIEGRLTNKKMLEAIHKSTLKTLLKDIVKNYYANGEEALTEALYRNLSGLGKPGKIAQLPDGSREYFSPFARLDVAHDNGQILYLLDD